jgi:signal transduction histidine kinase
MPGRIGKKLLKPKPMMDTRPEQELSENAQSGKRDAVAPPISVRAELPELQPAASRRYPIRFIWQIDAEGRFTIGSSEFTTLVGPQTAAALGRPWPEVAAALNLDPERQVARALTTHETWAGLLVAWPVDESIERLTVELSGLPVFDRGCVFRGYRGFGVCRDPARLAALARVRLGALRESVAVDSEEASEPTVLAKEEDDVPLPLSNASEAKAPEAKAPSLSPVERGAFRELARRLTERLSNADIDDELADIQDIPLQADPPTADPQSSTAEVSKPAEPLNSRGQSKKVPPATTDFVARISHEVRTPLNAIIGFAEGIMEERFGPLGNDRYREYLKDIHASGTRLVSLIDALLDLAKIEAGEIELAFANVTINDIIQQCVVLVQPQANERRVIIRTSLSPKLPQVIADAASVRQIILNLLSNPLKLLGAGGQVIISTALTDRGELVLRVRDTGQRMSGKEIAAALEPFSKLATSTRFGSGGADLALPLTRALAQANGASFRIDSKSTAGTLIEISFPSTCLWTE